jgi:hypothetical protein
MFHIVIILPIDIHRQILNMIYNFSEYELLDISPYLVISLAIIWIFKSAIPKCCNCEH